MPELPDFAEFYGASFDRLCVQLYAHTGDQAEAQDVVQEAFCRALARWHRISRYDDPAAWVRKVAWNLATSRWRKVRANRVFVLSTPEEHAPAPDSGHLDVIAALKSLPERQRQAVVMHYLSDIPIAEIAAMTGAAEGTVKSWLHRARATLDSRLRGAEWPAAVPPGSDTARKTVRRRRDRNTLAIIVVLVCVAVTALLFPYMDFRDQPITDVTPKPSVSPDPSGAPSAPPVPAGAAPAGPSGNPGASCVSDPVGLTTDRPTGSSVPVRWVEARTGSTSRPLCAGVRLKLNWASYTLDSQMDATLHRSGSVYLDDNRATTVVNVETPPACYVWYVTGSDLPVPPFIDALWRQMDGLGGPFWDERHQQRGVIQEQQNFQCPSPTPSA